MSAPQSRRLRPRIIDVVAILCILIVSMIPLWPVYEHPAIIVMCAGALAIGTLIAILGARWPAYAVIAATAGAYGLFGVPLAVRDYTTAGVLPTPQGLRELTVGTVGAWRQMLTVAPPFGTYEALMVPALIVVLVATVLGVSLTIRASRAGWAMVAPLSVLAFGIAFGSHHVLQPVVTGLAIAVLAMLWATVRADPLRSPTGFAGMPRKVSRSTIRRHIAAVVLIGLCAGGAFAVHLALPTDSPRVVLRTDIVPPMDTRDLLSPLIGYQRLMRPPDSETLKFSVQGMPEGARIRLATLDAYTGIVFAVGTDTSSGSFERVPYRIDHDDPRRSHRVTFTIAQLDGRWLPTLGDLVAIDFTSDPKLADAFYYNTTTASAALTSELSSTTYSVEALVTPMAELGDIAAMSPGSAHQREVVDVPDEIADAAVAHGGTGTPGERLVALTRWLQSGYVSHGSESERPSRPGHTAERLILLMTKDPMLGDAEQYATAMALLAREVGFPSRVVVGYAPTAGQVDFTGGDTTAWVEVQVSDGRWIAVDPNPEPREIPENQTIVDKPRARPQSVLPPPPPTDDEPVTTEDDDSDRPKDPDDEGGWWATLLRVLRLSAPYLAIGALLTLPLWALALAAALRRSLRRRHDRTRAVVTGGWNEVRDAMIDRGYDIAPAATRREIAALVDSDSIHQMADQADETVFAGRRTTAKDVGSYWSQLRSARRSLDVGISRQQRMLRVIRLQSARSLWRSVQSWRRTRGKARP